jgi:hypothetical protein
MMTKSGESRPEFESGEPDLVTDDDGESRQSDRQRMVMKQRDPEQDQCEQDEIEGNSKDQHCIDHDNLK